MKKSKRTKIKKAKSNIVVALEADDTTCTECYAEFLDPVDLELHMQQMHPPGPPGELVPCQFCDQVFSNAEVYVLHIRDVHLVDLRQCSHCTRVYSNIHLLRSHERKHTDALSNNKYSCFQCHRSFENNYSLRQHDATHRCDDGGVFINDHYALLSSVINMKADSVIEAIGKDFIYVCSCCKYSSSDLLDYISHLKVQKCRTLACDMCYKVYSRRQLMRDHIMRSHKCRAFAKLASLKQCSKCNKNIDSKEFKAHFKSCTVLKCPSCNLLFENFYALSEHQSAEHPLSVALVSCKFCRKECVGKVSLEKHVERSHKHEFHLYKYTCTYCDTSFKHPQRLFAHYFMKHKEIEPYLCKICDKKFRLRKPFTLHIKLTHQSNGFVEFDERLHVFFTEQKSEKPFQPVSKYGSEPAVADKTNKSKVTSTNKDQGMETDNNEDVRMENINSDFMNPTETEGNQTENESSKTKRKRKTKLKKDIETIILSEDYDSEDEPLVVIKKKAKIKSQLRKRGLQMSKKCKNWKFNIKQRFTCEICKKYCYTFQNYNNHLSMHFKDECKKCIKCSRTFKTKSDLQKHLEEKHASSKLTETLKQLLERRKTGNPRKEISNTQKFLKTIKKVVFDKDNVTATLSPVNSELSLQKFIENFTPEANESKNIQIKNCMSITKVSGQLYRAPVIKMTKFQPPPKTYGTVKLSMPVKFKIQNHEKHSVTIRKVEPTYESKIKIHCNDGNQFQDDYDNDYNYNYDQEDNKDAHIPEAEQEVTLEGTEEPPPPKKVVTHKIILPKFHKELKSIRIAHLLPEAPYYKIVKMDEIIKQPGKKEPPKVEPSPSQPVRLPDGTKLVHVNPLAHLLGDTPIENIVRPHSKYYKPKAVNVQDALAKALLKIPNRKYRKKPPKAAKNAEKKQAERIDEIVEQIDETVERIDETVERIDETIERIDDTVEELAEHETSLPIEQGNENISLPCIEEQVRYENKSLPCLDDGVSMSGDAENAMEVNP